MCLSVAALVVLLFLVSVTEGLHWSAPHPASREGVVVEEEREVLRTLWPFQDLSGKQHCC